MRLIDVDKHFEMNDVFYKADLKMPLSAIKEVLENTETVEAIPIEWLRRWANKNCMYCFDFDVPTEKYESWYAINDMIEDFEKENETNRCR